MGGSGWALRQAQLRTRAAKGHLGLGEITDHPKANLGGGPDFVTSLRQIFKQD